MLRSSHARSFHIPRPQRDRVNLRQLAALAGVCLSVGVALSGALREREPHGLHHAYDAPGSDGWEESAVQAAQAEQAEQATQTLQAIGAALQTQTESSISAATSPPTAADAPPANTAAASSTRAAAAAAGQLGRTSTPAKLALQRGAVSYRCDMRNKCPRDRALEARVWRVLARLTSCRDATSTLGRAVLQLRLTPDAAPIASFSAPAIAQSLNLRAVSQCVAGELSKIKTTRKLDRIELSMGFGLSGPN